ncbi:putative gamma-glutamyltransferase YwrD [Calidithermus terrae]|uniref:Putative gamma-glutamyltransferase YwrD n=1 Tax=Calidithermus terrae TaxID=1408545 RepID=A0A399ELY4_9DEIN|nr:gamma-glutamyltransferase family protein [Calidithermus terrae]RIH83141.1 putative gamma-glutamyltransferase YwrD [Calidithermus terrae]
MDLNYYPYPSRRTVMVGKRGAVATSQPQAALAGMEMLLAGGNAADAALAIAIALTVLEPTSNGIGSDAFALIWDGKLHGLNASGPSPSQLPPSAFEGMQEVPARGWLPVTVPGTPAGWRAVSERFGKLPFERLFEPAIRYAEEGFAVSPVTARGWGRSAETFLKMSGPEHRAFNEVFFPGGRGPRAGEVWRSPGHAATLREIASSHAESFYRGALAQKTAEFAAATGGWLAQADLAAYEPEWVEPISAQYGGLELHEIPPNGQGIAALMALKILGGFDMARAAHDPVEYLHLQVEAMKLAFADVQAEVTDPRHMRVGSADLLDETYLSGRRRLIGDTARAAEAGIPKGGTVYLCAADGELMVSFIQSNYMGFGAGVLVPGTGIALQNRGAGFVLEPGHPNRYAPAKRPFHTIIPGFLTRGGKPLGPFGVMGGHMQPQGHLQVVLGLEDMGLNPQAVLDAPRWQWVKGKQVLLEPSVPQHVVQGLIDRGHQVVIQPEAGLFGRGQIILRQGETLVAGSEPRADGQALAW